MRKPRNYRRELVQAADDAAARIFHTARTGALLPQAVTVKLLRDAWLAGHAAAKKETKDEQP